MNSNPFAVVFRTAFEKDILQTAIVLSEAEETPRPALRTKLFLNELNRFLMKNGQQPVLWQKYVFEEAKLFEYALFLRGYMRDAQNVLVELRPEQSADPDLIRLFKASSEYVVACNRQFGNRKVFDNQADYCLWQLHFNKNIESSPCTRAPNPSAKRHNVFLFMPFRIKEEEAEIQKWCFTNMQHSMDQTDIFGKDVDVYVNFYPIKKSRSDSVFSLLETLRNPSEYVDSADKKFVGKYWLDFIGQDLRTDENGRILSGKPYEAETLKANLANISIFSYCSGTANAHRCLNALRNVALQLYPKAVVEEALHGIGVMSYGFLPIQAQSPYSGIHFYTNAVGDKNRREPFVNLNNHTLYERTKCTSPDLPARYSLMRDGRNWVVALKMPETAVLWKKDRPEAFRDKEFGHSILHITAPCLNDPENYAHNLFCSTFEQFCLGKRGAEALNFNRRDNTDNRLMHSFLYGSSNHLRS